MVKRLSRNGLVIVLALGLSACAPTGFFADTWVENIWPFSGPAKNDLGNIDAAFAARAKELLEQNEERLKKLRDQQSSAMRQADDLSAEKKSLSEQLQAEREAAFLVQVDGGDISLNKLDNMPTCDMLKSTISGLPGQDKMAKSTAKPTSKSMTSMFSVGSVSPYATHNLLLSKCLAARDVPKL